MLVPDGKKHLIVLLVKWFCRLLQKTDPTFVVGAFIALVDLDIRCFEPLYLVLGGISGVGLTEFFDSEVTLGYLRLHIVFPMEQKIVLVVKLSVILLHLFKLVE